MATAVVCLMGSVSLAVQAHHSFAMYDTQRLVTVKGTIKAFQWTNPHAVIWLIQDAGDGDGAGAEWTIELPTSPGALTRLGWDKHSLPPGEHVIVELNPLRTGLHGGSFKKVTLVKSGTILIVAPPPAPGANAP